MPVTLSASSSSGNPHGTVICTLSDSAQSVTIDPALLAGFAAGDECDGSLVRTTDDTVAVIGGYVTFETSGASVFTVPVQ